MSAARQPRLRWNPPRLRKVRFFIGALLVVGNADLLRAAGEGDRVVVVYNQKVPESRPVAEYYARRREVPTNQIFGFDLPLTETMTRQEYHDQLHQPLLKALTDHQFIAFESSGGSGTSTFAQPGSSKVKTARIRYAVLCYGVPTRILRDDTIKEDGLDKLRPELRRNEAAVDSELACLPISLHGHFLTGPLSNPLYGVTNAADCHPTNGVLLVTRLDGPSAAIARGLVDKAIEAETNGLWGRAYFDARALTNGNYKLGDDWIRNAADIVRRLGFDTVLDTRPETFPVYFPLSQVAFYAGWYDGDVSGPFTRPTVEFMPGAIAYHLHSFSASSIRTVSRHWVGPLLAKGATATIGYVDEPYLEGTAELPVFFTRIILQGFSLGEAAYACQGSLSWQSTVLGDPLYRPFGRPAQQQHEELAQRGSKLIEWSHLRVVNLNLAMDLPVPQLIDYLEKEPLTRKSGVLSEKLADLYSSRAKFQEAIGTYAQALKLDPSGQQRVRVMLNYVRVLSLYQEKEAAYAVYQEFLTRFPDYGDPVSIHEKMLSLAQTLGKSAEAEKHRQAITNLTAGSSSKP